MLSFGNRRGAHATLLWKSSWCSRDTWLTCLFDGLAWLGRLETASLSFLKAHRHHYIPIIMPVGLTLLFPSIRIPTNRLVSDYLVVPWTYEKRKNNERDVIECGIVRTCQMALSSGNQNNNILRKGRYMSDFCFPKRGWKKV